MNIPTELFTPEYWAKVESEPRRPNTREERMVLAGWEDWDGWEIWYCDYRFATRNFVKCDEIQFRFQFQEYILRRKVVVPRRWGNVDCIQYLDDMGWKITQYQTPMITLIELLPGWQVVPPDSVVLSKEQVLELMDAITTIHGIGTLRGGKHYVDLAFAILNRDKK